MIIQLANCTNTLLAEVNMEEIDRDGIALMYAMAICSDEKTDWPAVNTAIADRFGKRGLAYIKRQAWGRIEKA